MAGSYVMYIIESRKRHASSLRVLSFLGREPCMLHGVESKEPGVLCCISEHQAHVEADAKSMQSANKICSSATDPCC